MITQMLNSIVKLAIEKVRMINNSKTRIQTIIWKNLKTKTYYRPQEVKIMLLMIRIEPVKIKR